MNGDRRQQNRYSPHSRTRRRDIDPVASLAEVLKCYAPSEAERDAIDYLVADMRRVQETTDGIARSLAGYLYDGLAYGNWPWVVAKMKSV